MTNDADKVRSRRAPVQPSRGVPFPTSVAWRFHERAWSQYAAYFGRSQSAERLAERGGFSAMELVTFMLGKDPMGSSRPTDAEIATVRAEIEAYDSELAATRADVDRLTRELATEQAAYALLSRNATADANNLVEARARAEKAEAEVATLTSAMETASCAATLALRVGHNDAARADLAEREAHSARARADRAERALADAHDVLLAMKRERDELRALVDARRG